LFVLSACATGPAPILNAAQPTQGLQAASVPKGLNPTTPSNSRYGFRKPTALLKVDLYSTSHKDLAQKHIKEFFARYVDKNDIFNYQILQNESDSDKFTVNVFGGKQDFVYGTLLKDLKFYLQQRMRFDNLAYYTGY